VTCLTRLQFSHEEIVLAWGPFLERPGKLFGPESQSEISNLTITELFYLRILNINRGSLYTRSFRHIRLSVFRYR